MEEEHYSMWGWEQFFSEVESFLIHTNRGIDSSSLHFAEYSVERFGVIIRALASILEPLAEQEQEDLVEIRSLLEEIVECCVSLLYIWQSYIDSLINRCDEEVEGFQVPRVMYGRGRPRAVISQDQLQYLRSMNFSWVHITELLGVSRVTLYRRRMELGIQDSDILREMDDDELRRFMGQVREEFPNIGESLVIGRLHSMGYHVPRNRVRRAIRTTDPINTALRWRGIITTRRPYSVPGTNSLWHIGKYCFSA